jgi:hypothetical protein
MFPVCSRTEEELILFRERAWSATFQILQMGLKHGWGHAKKGYLLATTPLTVAQACLALTCNFEQLLQGVHASRYSIQDIEYMCAL